ncbi:TetR/AcrR family transcriptional regulator (plasmid) [Tistrella bauzanensis]|uniref:TetR/AcrR family transcriptional regulator n=1 Tax=Tistrella TaxID=171436 RepID=UPI0031F66308
MTESDDASPTVAPVAEKRRRAPTKRVKERPLTENDWVEAAIDILVEENVRGIQLHKLCTVLGVTKGSFYWHFKKRSDLLAAMLQTWRSRMTLNVIQNITRTGPHGMDRLRRLLILPRRPKSRAFAAIESSIRDWARRVEMPRKAIWEVDQIRMSFFEQIFRDHGFDEDEARKRSYIAYCAMMGDSVLHKTLGDQVDEAAYVDKVVELLTAPLARPGTQP